MLDKEKRRAEYLAKAKEAKETAEKLADKETREQWERIAEAYLGLAKTT
jgi:hypothetical protein